MGESELIVHFTSEVQLTEFAALVGQRWRAAAGSLVVGLCGELGSGKTTWVRALLRGLGYPGRVPSPTYTLLEHYVLPGLTVVHLDLYRLANEQDLEPLGVRDWLARPAPTWVLVEWPERAPRLAMACDLTFNFSYAGETGRELRCVAQTEAGIAALRGASDAALK